ncbi:MAG: hypothetical protein Q9196_004743, partial [Gyalolechia fulgens]
IQRILAVGAFGSCPRNDGQTVSVMLEWGASAPIDIGTHIAEVVENIPTEVDVNRPEEIRTLKIQGTFKEALRTALVYECPQQLVNLHDVLLNIKKPSGVERRMLSSILATQIRSLHVHFRLVHTALRPESFVFAVHQNKPELIHPYVLDWGRALSQGIYQHPEYQATQPLWFYDVWSLMIVLSEIAEWRPADGTFQGEKELLRKKLERKQKATDPNWKGDLTAKIFQYGFGFLEKDRHTLEHLSRRDIKRFFDKLCKLLEAPAVC